MQTIVCVDANWGIGVNNQLLFHIPKDLEYFKEKTLGKIVVMGGNTFFSLPNSRPLPDRTNIVITDLFKREDCLVYETLPELIDALKEYDMNDIFIIGGAMFYKTMLEYCEYALVTKVDEVCEKATVFFPNLDELPNWVEIEKSEMQRDNNYKFYYVKYKNLSVKPL